MHSKNLLYLAHRIPYPPDKGDKIRSFNEIRHLSSDYNIDLICLADDPDDLQYENKLKEICRRVAVLPLRPWKAKVRGVLGLLQGNTISESYFYSGRLQKIFDQWTASSRYQGLICFSSPMAEYIFRSKNYDELLSSTKMVMDFCDLDSDKWLQYSRRNGFPLSMIYRVEGKRLLRYEMKINGVFQHCLFVSEKEAELFRQHYPEAENVDVVPNGVDSDYFSPSDIPADSTAHAGPHLLFTGAMDYYANVDGVVWFCEEVFPRIQAEFPDSVFIIAGKHPTGKVKQLAVNANVRVKGFVEDIRSCYRQADISVIPLRIARGVQNKVLEAMAMGKAVVTTSAAIQGIRARNGEHLLVADTPGEFAAAVAALLHDPAKRKTIGLAAREQVIKEYSWSGNMEMLNTVLADHPRQSHS